MVRKIGLMDFGTRSAETNSLSIIEQVVNEAVLAEQLGYSRLWYGEHFIARPNIPWFSPEPILPLICGYTGKIRVGVAGVLIHYNSPLRVAANFKLLNNLFDNRIDLGYAKGSPVKSFLPYVDYVKYGSFDESREGLNARIDATRNLLMNEQQLIREEVLVPPFGGAIPDQWNLVGSVAGYQHSLELQLNCSRTIFHKNVDLSADLDKLQEYRENFRNRYGYQPQVNIAVAGTCQGSPPAIEHIIRESTANMDFIEPETRVCGAPAAVFDRLSFYAEKYGVDEIIFYEISRSEYNRKNSLELISEVFQLADATAPVYV